MKNNAGILTIGFSGSAGRPSGISMPVASTIWQAPVLRRIRRRPAPVPNLKPGWAPPPPKKKEQKGKKKARSWKLRIKRRRRDRSVRDLRIFFRHEIGRFRDVFPKDDEFYAYPWFLMIGEKGSGKTTLLGASGLEPWSAEQAATYVGARYCAWWCSANGAVMDLDGALILNPPAEPDPDNEQEEEETPEPAAVERDGWPAIMKLLRRYRLRRPIDGVILAIPATDLVGSGRLDEAAAAAKGEVIAQKLRAIASRLGMSVPVYPIITKCDRVTGFADFCRMLPEDRRGEIFGWSNPDAIDVPYNETWIDDAFNFLGASVAPVRLEMFAELPEGADGDGLFLFPSELRSMAPTLRAWLEPIFAPNGTHARLQLRGLYVAGDGAAIPSVPPPADPPRDGAPEPAIPSVPFYPPFGPPLPEGPAETGARNGNGHTNGNGASNAGEDAGVLPVDADPDASAELPEPEPADRRIFFADRLFYRKIFPEFSIAQPLARIGFAKNRMVLALQIMSLLVIVLGFVAAYVEYPVLRASTDTLYSTLDTIRHDLNNNRLESVHPTAEDVVYAQHLLDGIIRAEQCRTVSPLFPSSWFSALHDSVDLAFAYAFDQEIMRAMYQQLVNKVGELRNYAQRRQPYLHEQYGLDTDDSFEFRTLRAFADELIVLQKHAGLYNNLKHTRRVDDVAALVEYLFERKLPENFVSRARHFAVSLEAVNARQFVHAEHRDTLRPVVDFMLQRLLDKLFSNNVILINGRAVRDSLHALARGGTNGFVAAARLGTLAKNIGTLNAALQDSSLAWLSQPEFEPGADLTVLLHDLDISPFFATMRTDSQLTERFFDSCRARFITVKEEIRSLNSEIISGPVVPMEPLTAAFVPSPTLDSLKAAIESLLARPFMRARSRGSLAYRQGFSRQLIWNADELEKAVKLFDEFNAFTDENLPEFPKEMQAIVTTAARTCFEASSIDIIEGARHIETNPPSPESVRREVKSLQNASTNLVRLLNLYDRPNFTLRGELLGVLWNQCQGIFSSLTDARESNHDIYAINNHGVQRWLDLTQPLDRPLSSLLLDLDEEPAIAEKLAADRAYVEDLAQQGAQPALDFLGSIGMPSRGGEIEEWRKILVELQKYARGVPGNSVAVLEALFLDLNNINESNFREKLVKRGTNNYFLRRREYLRSTLDTMFSSRVLHGAIAAYNDLRSTFNTTLLGRYPFTDFTAYESKRISSVMIDELDEYFERLDAFIARYDQVRKYWGRADARPEERRVYDFIDSLLRVRNFLSPIIDADSEQQAHFSLDIEFRVNQVKEAGGKDIIGWTLEVGETAMDIEEYVRNGSRPWRTTWRVGDRINFQLRWADQSPVIPHDVFLGLAQVDGRAVNYGFNNSTWSLIHLLSVHRAPVGHVERNSPPHVLEFTVNTIPRVATASSVTTYTTPPPEEARVFMRIGVVGSSRREHVQMPVFPTTPAPDLPRERK